ncbi:GuaB3 family IMP dehydrogenase-related protein, partial [Leifsonia sp. SIMBA_070]
NPLATRRLQEIYDAPIQAELITSRLAEVREAGVTVAGSLTPQRTQEFYKTVLAAGVDIFVIRGTTVSAEHVSKTVEP